MEMLHNIVLLHFFIIFYSLLRVRILFRCAIDRDHKYIFKFFQKHALFEKRSPDIDRISIDFLFFFNILAVVQTLGETC